MDKFTKTSFELTNKTIIITGGAGLLGKKHAEAVAEFGGNPIILDINEQAANQTAKVLNKIYNVNSLGYRCDITSKQEVLECCRNILEKYKHIDVLINNAAIDPKVDKSNSGSQMCRLENFSIEQWNSEIAVGLTGALICTQVFGYEMAKRKMGIIINISSDLGIIAPDQRLYEKEGISEDNQSVKPVTYSVIKHGLIGLTKYIATYWTKDGVRANTLCPAGVYTNQSDEFVEKISRLIPMRRMADINEYKAAIVFLASDASSYMNGQTLIIDGGRSIL